MSNALDSASLIMIPSGYEDGTLGSVKPTDGTGDFTFSRGSDISATRVNEDGYIEKGYENLLLQSNSFTTSPWSSVRASVTGGQSGYDGTNDAWVFQPTSVNSAVINSISNSGVATFSVYAKANSVNWIKLQMFGSVDCLVYFDLNPNTIGNRIGTQLSNIDASIEDVGNGWFRCSMVFNSNTTSVLIFPSIDNDVAGDANSSIYIQDAMINQGLVAYPYVETTTAPVAGGILEDMPRLDYTDSSCPALLLEPQRTNLISRSEYFSDSFWTGAAQVTDNATISPEGKNNAALLSDTSISATLSYIRLLNTGATTIGATYTLSLYVKPKGNSRVFKFWARNTDSPATFFDLVDGTTSEPSSSTIEDVGDGWWRVSSTGQLVSGEVAAYFYVYTDADNVEGFYMWGAQLEEGSYPTSYIPTNGTSQTRLEDSATASNAASIIGQTEGTIFIDVEMNAENGDVINIKPISGSFYANGIGLGNLSQVLRLQVHKPSGTTQVVYPLSVGGRFKFGIRYDTNNLAFFVNGSKFYDNPTTINFSVDLNEVELYGKTTTGRKSTKRNNKTLIFPTALSDDECIALTTI